MKPSHLHAVPDKPVTKDVTMLLRADIEKRDWAACHIAGDKGVPVSFGDRVKRMWLR